MSHPLVTTDWLADHIDDPTLSLVDASWYLPAMQRNPRAEHLASHLPGAVFFDIDAIADTSTGLPHMLPGPEAFAAAVGALGIADTDTIVVYDEAGIFSAPRVWWSFHVMGARDVRVLDGGGPKWRREGRATVAGETHRPPRQFTPHFRPADVLAHAEMRDISATGRRTIVDARPNDRFRGAAPEPRAGLASGHMPGARNVPAGTLVRDGEMKPVAEIARLFSEAGVDPMQPIVTTCGSGVTAATLYLGLTLLNAPNLALYDGSWTDWASRADAPVEKD